MSESYEKCKICPRECGVDRSKGQFGRCRSGDKIKAARAALHMWEEPCISGAEGSGAVFFSGCSLGCIFCQNKEISEGKAGIEIPVERLAEIFLELEEQGANNINLVTAGHFLPHIVRGIELSRNQGLHLPIVYNSSGYEKVDMIKMLEGYVDIYLPDFKYMSSETAAAYSQASDYPGYAKLAVEEMVRQQPVLKFDERGMMKCGVIVRHMLMPGHVKEACQVVDYLYHTYKEQIYISLMSQYTPMNDQFQDSRLNRKVTRREYRRLIDYACELGITQGFWQEGKTAEESFIPAFDGEGIIKI